MAFMDWNDNLSVQIPSIDAQHKKLLAMLNDFYDSMKAGKGKEALAKILCDLIQYTKTHFATEERLMETHQYAGRVTHKKEHDKLTQKVLELDGKFKEGKATISIEVLNFLKDWLSNHIMGVDKQYGPFLSGKGVQ